MKHTAYLFVLSAKLSKQFSESATLFFQKHFVNYISICCYNIIEYNQSFMFTLSQRIHIVNIFYEAISVHSISAFLAFTVALLNRYYYIRKTEYIFNRDV